MVYDCLKNTYYILKDVLSSYLGLIFNSYQNVDDNLNFI